MGFVDVNLMDLFTLKNGKSKFTKAYVSNHEGIYKLYAANTDGSYQKIDSYDYDGNYLTWVKDGLAGYIMVHQDEKFSITGHRSIMIPKNKNIDLLYVKYVLEPIFRKMIKGRLGEKGKNEYTTLNPKMIENSDVKIPIPVKTNGEYDIIQQKTLARKYEFIDEKKAQVQDLIDIVTNTSPTIVADNMVAVPISDIFDLSVSSNGNFLTKSFVDNHKGNIPVYGATESEEIASYGYIEDNLNGVKYFENCVTVNRNGSVGKAFYRKGRFVINNDVTPLVIKEEYKDVLCQDYLSIVVENTISPHFTYLKKAGKSLFKDFTIPIPQNPDGSFNVELQKKIAEKYHRIKELKNDIKSKAEKLMNAVILVD